MLMVKSESCSAALYEMKILKPVKNDSRGIAVH